MSNTEEDARKAKVFHGEGLEYNSRFKEWWMEARKSEEPPTPYAFLTNFGMDSGNVTEMCWSTIISLIHGTPGPGVFDYFVYCLRDGLKNNTHGWCHCPEFTESRMVDPIKTVLENEGGATEQDIKSLVQVIPASRDSLALCIANNYSEDLMDSFFENILEDDFPLEFTLDSGRREVLDENLMSIVYKQIGCFESITITKNWEWTEKAFTICLSMMLQKDTPREWEVWIPDAFVGGSDDVQTVHPHFPQQEGISGIEDLTLHFSDNNEYSNLRVMQILPNMISLEYLKLELGSHSKSATPYLARYLQTTTALEYLCIDNSKRSDNRLEKMDLLDLFEPLKTNTSIGRFSYIGVNEEEMRFCEGKLLRIIEECNTALIDLKLRTSEQSGDYNDGFVQQVRDQIDYYLMLNESGRGKARDPELQLEELLDLLDHANVVEDGGYYCIVHVDDDGNEYEEVEEDRFCDDALNKLFGLLREQPVIWSKANSNVDIIDDDKSLKRKHRNQQENSKPNKQQKEN